MHLRLRFQNLGKPRTAGLCGREGSLCDHLSLSCAKIERLSPLEKPSCKVRFFAQNHSRIYRQKVTATTLLQTASYPDFQLLSQTAHVRFRSRKRVHTRRSDKDRTRRLARRNRGLPSLDHSAALCRQRNTLHSATLLYTYISRFSVNPHHKQREKIRQSSRHGSISSRFSTSRTNGPRLLSRVKAGNTLAFAQKIAHSGSHAETGGVLDGM